MATITVTQARVLRNQNGASPTTKGGAENPNVKETAGQTYVVGSPVYRDTNGTIALAVASSNIVQYLAGFATKAATGVTGASARYRVLSSGDVLVVNLKGTSTSVTALTQLGTNTTGGAKTMFDISSGNLVANPDAAFDANKLYGEIIGLYTVADGYGDGDTVGDTNGRLLVMIPAQSALQG